MIFRFDGEGWKKARTLRAPDGVPNDRVGFSVAQSGDWVLVAAPFHQVGANVRQGAAYTFPFGDCDSTISDSTDASDACDPFEGEPYEA